jgi:hypothetical protein
VSIRRFPVAGDEDLAERPGGLGTTTPEAHGAVGDGTTDDTAAFQSALDASPVLVCDPSKTYRIDGQLAFTYANEYRRITSNGGTQSELFQNTDNPTQGAILDLRYGGSEAKIVGFYDGTLEIDHITLADRGSSDIPFIKCTETAPKIHHVTFVGNPTKYRGTCDQDAVVLGGLLNTVGANDPDGGFQGYSGFVLDCSFHRIRRAVTWNNFANSFPAQRNVINPSCGSDRAVDAPFVLDSGTANTFNFGVSGNVVTDNLIEMFSDYAHGIILRNGAAHNMIGGNSIWDHTPDGKYVSDILCDAATGARENFIFHTGYSEQYTVSGFSPRDGSNYYFGPQHTHHPTPMCRIWRDAGNQAATSGAITTVDFTATEVNDDTDLYTVDLASNTIVVADPGLYQFYWDMFVNGGGVGERNAILRLDGVGLRTSGTPATATGAATNRNIGGSAAIRITGTDVAVTLALYSDGGSDTTIRGDSPTMTGLAVVRVGD